MIQHYVIKFVSDLLQADGFSIKLIDITEILLKVVLNTMTLTHGLGCLKLCGSQIDKDDF